MSKCSWKSKDKTKDCKRHPFKDSSYCLFHKKNKNKFEAFIFWEVININYFKFLDGRLINYLNQAFSVTENSLKEYPELNLLLSTRKVNLILSEKESLCFGASIRKAIYILKQQYGNSDIANEIIIEYKQSGLHGYYAGDFNGFVFPKGKVNFDFKVNPSSMMNFFGLLNFEETVFEGSALFINYNFNNYKVYFKAVAFNREVSFKNSRFDGDVNFINTKLYTMYNIIGETTFKNTVFSGDLLSFSGGNLCTLAGIKMSGHTDIVIDDDVVIPNFERIVGNIGAKGHNKIIRDEIFHIAKKQANRTGDVSLINRYETQISKFRFNYGALVEDLIDIAIVLQKRLTHTYLKEDMYNDFIVDALRFKNYHTSDQSRGGRSGKEKSAGELDIEVSNEYKKPFSIIEALRLKSVNKSYIKDHIVKLLFNYDTSGHEKNIIIVYYCGKNFRSFSDKYYGFMKNVLKDDEVFSGKNIIDNVVVEESPKADLFLITTNHKRNKKNTSITHILINISI